MTSMDLINWSQAALEPIAAEFAAYAAQIGLEVTAIPVSGATGANFARRGEGCDWYAGPTLLGTLEALSPLSEGQDLPFRMTVQGVIRPHLDFAAIRAGSPQAA